ncbi:toxin-antitoxin system YwqK family antitoxin [Moritella viscosa]|uniref:toxin-antitoxin system YwqK family antitoxin n=3 Tax=Moritella viscosa TaxID=80854 RepID=UPI0009206B40|nr:hypothetical protein [Moritella viscosa]SHO27402.1 Morn repeat-containing protein [Moritella viscosa]
MNNCFILLALLLFSCANQPLSSLSIKEIPAENVTEDKGLIFEKGSQIPFTGSLIKYHSNGNLRFKVAFIDGKQNGPYLRYYDTGTLKLKTNYKNGKEDGLHQFYRRGKLWHQKYFKNGKLHGVTNKYWPNGQLRESTCYIKGKMHDISGCNNL